MQTPARLWPCKRALLVVQEQAWHEPIRTGVNDRLIYDGFTRWRTTRLVEDTAPEPVRSIAVGQTEVSGTCEPIGEPIDRPFSDGECVLAYWEIERYDGDGWETLASGGRYTPFVIDDGTGSIRVEPPSDVTTRLSDPNSTQIMTGGTRFGRQESEPIVEFLDSRDDIDLPETGILFREQRRYTEWVVPPSEDVYVFGGASIRDDAEGSNPDRLVLSEDDATGKFIVSDRSQDEFTRSDRWQTGAQIGIGLTIIVIVLALIVLQLGSG